MNSICLAQHSLSTECRVRMSMRRSLLVGLIAVLNVVASQAHGAEFLVTNLDDASDANGVTTDTGSLCYAMLLANDSADTSNAIVFSPGLSGHILLTAHTLSRPLERNS